MSPCGSMMAPASTGRSATGYPADDRWPYRRYPHDYEGADVEQQYLPDLLVDRRYYEPTAEGMERLIGERLALDREARASAAPKKARATGPNVDPMRVAGGVMKARESAKRSGT